MALLFYRRHFSAGVIRVTDRQPVMRPKMLPKLDAKGNPELRPDGSPIVLPVLDKEGNHVWEHVKDKDGRPMFALVPVKLRPDQMSVPKMRQRKDQAGKPMTVANDEYLPPEKRRPVLEPVIENGVPVWAVKRPLKFFDEDQVLQSSKYMYREK